MNRIPRVLAAIVAVLIAAVIIVKTHNYLYTLVGEVRNADRIWSSTPQKPRQRGDQ